MTKRNKHQQKAIPQAGTGGSGSRMPILIASMMSGSKVLEQSELGEELRIDAVFLDGLCDSLPAENAARFSPWLEHFSGFCKALEKKSSALTQERDALIAEREQSAKLLEQEKADLHKQRDHLSAEQQELKEHDAALKPRLEDIARKGAELIERELALEAQELDARNGFVTRKQQMLEGVKQDIRTLELTRDRLLQDIESQKDRLSTEQQARDAELEKRERDLELKGQANEKTRLRLQRQQDEVDEERHQLQIDIDAAIEEERNRHDVELERQKASLERAYQQLDEERDRVVSLRELLGVLGERDPQQLLDELQELRKANATFRTSGLAAEREHLTEENQGLRGQVAILESKLRDLVPELEQSKIELSRKRMGAAELETLAIEKRGLEKQKQLLSVHLGELEARIDQLTAASKAQSAFPQLSAMDGRDEFRIPPALESVPEDLEIFANELQQRIAMAEQGTKLYYQIEDIRTLLGGLAMSQLHVFQGISGTGKTSLAKAFAKAMGGFCTDIAVQAGWRDRDDLLGHYNAFEKRFYEKDCLQALYQAQTDAWSDRCNVILLDEMNLSRPEQYFAEFLSALEKNNPAERLITLSENAMAQAPRLLKEQRKIMVPQNVWFIGTANHDETTNELADKTYDRAHVMALPRHEGTFNTETLPPVHYSFQSLQQRFTAAVATYGQEVQKLLDQLQQDELTTVLEEGFGLGWGNRFERQAKRFIPVMMACGASQHDALDHLLSTRVMRSGKVTGRYDISVDDLGKMENALDQFWKNIGGQGAAKSKKMLDEDRRRKERGA